MRSKINKKGVSPIIATILLIALVVVIGLVIFQWFKGMTKEAITKFDGQNVELVCNDVSFDATYSAGTLSISNLGNVPIYSMNLKIEEPGSHSTQNIKDISTTWPENGLNQGGVFSEDIGNYIGSNTNTITLIPILIGVDKDGNRKTSPCKDNQGYPIYI